MRFIAIILWGLFIVLCIAFPPLGIGVLIYSFWRMHDFIETLSENVERLERKIQALENELYFTKQQLTALKKDNDIRIIQLESYTGLSKLLQEKEAKKIQSEIDEILNKK